MVIITKYLKPTNSRVSRIKAQCYIGVCNTQVTLAYDQALSVEQNHIIAAKKLSEKIKFIEQEAEYTYSSDSFGVYYHIPVCKIRSWKTAKDG